MKAHSMVATPLALVVGMVLLAIPAVSMAGPITFQFSGEITEVHQDPTLPDMPGSIVVGDAVHGYYTFDGNSTGTGSNPVIYVSSGAGYGFSLTIGNLVLTNDLVNILISDNASSGDSYTASSGESVGSGFFVLSLVYLEDPTGKALSSTDLPTVPPDLSSFTTKQGSGFYSAGGGSAGYFVYSLDSLSAIPEPTSFLLVGMGLAGIGLSLWRLKK